MEDNAMKLSILLLLVHSSLGAADPAPDKKIDFRRDVVPILSAHCFKCHQGRDASAGLRLDLKSELLGETNGEALVKMGNSKDSRLMHAVLGRTPGKTMPRNGPRLSAAQIDTLRAWIDQGLAWDEGLLPATVAADHWSFRPITRPDIPKVKNADWERSAIDAFIAAAHEQRGLTPASEADRATLIRRLSFDLRGVPPSPEEVDQFVGDTAANAYDLLVERMLSSPQHGERWARHWLDVARWAESEGYESNHLRPYSWRYRDYVVDAFNRDRPFDQFIREQIAGDELTPYSDTNLIATGFLAAARLSSNEEDKWRQRNDMLVDIVNATSGAFLGLTMSCAQCHNHKFDPITLRDYYRFQGFFLKGQPANLALRDESLWSTYAAKRPAEYEAAVQLKSTLFERGRARRIAEARLELSPRHLEAYSIPAEQRNDEQERLAREADLKFQFTAQGIEKGIPDEDRKLYDELKKKIERMEKDMPDRPQTFGYYSPITSAAPVDVLPMKGFYPLPYVPEELKRARPHMLLAGDVHRRGAAVDVGWPEVFVQPRTMSGTRLELANWIASPDNPLTARVWVNRLWHYHFGRGLVETPNDFGVKGSPPSHPELLDWLASELIRSGWSTRHIHRLIVGSRTYRQSSTPDPRNATIDAGNKYLWHWQPRRLEAEAIRDTFLTVSGELERTMGGKSVNADSESLRRSLYLLQKRDEPTPVAKLFDGPAAALESCALRHVSTVPLQSLYLLNSEFAAKRAAAFAKRVALTAGTSRERQIEAAFRIALNRSPDNEERRLAERFFAEQSIEGGLLHFCQALMNVNEFVYLE